MAADNGERYLPTIYNDEWLKEKGLYTSISQEEMRSRVSKLQPYSTNPIETGNYQPELDELLDSPSRFIREVTLR